MNIDFLLNHCLNDAMCRPNRIKNPDSNKIAKFVIKWLSENKDQYAELFSITEGLNEEIDDLLSEDFYHEDKIHDLKCIEPFFNQCRYKFKKFEVRKDDRDFEVGDYIRLHKYNPKTESYVKGIDPIVGRIEYKLKGGQFGVEKGYCVLGIDWDCIGPLVRELKY